MPHFDSVKRMIPVLGTFVRIELKSSHFLSDELHGFINQMFEAIKHVERLMSYYDQSSEVSKVNQAKIGEWFPLEASTYELLSFSETLRERSRGLFNVGFFDGWSGKFYELREDTKSIRKLSHGEIDLGGVAKGYAVDLAFSLVKEFYESAKITGSINAGGDVFLFESNEIQLGIQTSVKSGLDHRIVNIKNGAIATSASRREDNLRLSHRTGTGERVAISKTVSVFANTAMLADALTKVLLAAESDQEHEIAEACLSAYAANGFYEVHEKV